VGSTTFLGGFPNGGGGCGTPTKLQSVLVSGWGNASNASQAIAAVEVPGRGPLLVFDSVFEAPLSVNSSVVAMGGYPMHGADNAVLLSNVSSAGVAAPFFAPVNMDDGKGWQPANFTVFALPDGDPVVAAGLPALTAATTFFRSTASPVDGPPAGRTFDAVRDFGASNSGASDATAALQACIDAAAAASGGAVTTP